MGIHAYKERGDLRSRSGAGSIRQDQGNALQLVNDRLETPGQKTLQAVADDAPQTKQLSALREVVDRGNSSGNHPAVVQRVPDWVGRVLGTVRNNPGKTGLIAGGVAVGLYLAYRYWNQEPPQEVVDEVPDEMLEEENLPPPDGTTLAGVARALGIEVQVLKDQVDTGKGDIDINDIFKSGLDPDGPMTGVVPEALVKDLPDDEDGKVEAIFERLKHLGFSYTGSSLGGGVQGFLSREGDCSVLAQMFQLAAKAAGVDMVIGTRAELMLVDGRAVNGRDVNGNVDGPEPFWTFENHFWCVHKGQVYDVLFMQKGAVPYIRSSASEKYRDVEYHLFPNGRVLIYYDEEQHAKTGKQGIVMPQEEVKAYIDSRG